MQFFTLPETKDKIPAIGFGSGTKWRIHKWDLAAKDLELTHFVEELAEIILQVIKTGYLLIDTLEAYTTRAEVGKGLKDSGKPRSELFLTDKWSPGFRGSTLGPYDSLKGALKELDQEYVDLFLIHSPKTEKVGLTLEEAWEQMVQLKKDGLAKNIGVSNCAVEDLEKLAKFDFKPEVNQIEFHAYLQTQSPGVVDYCKKNDILLEAYGPLTPILHGEGPLDDLLDKLAAKYDRPKSQILLRWVYQNGVLPITTSSKIERLQDALKMFEFELEKLDFEEITKIGRTKVHRNFCTDVFSKYDDCLYDN